MKTKECITCCTDVYISRFPKTPHQGSESHGRDVCFKCWEQHLHSELTTKAWDQVSCAQCNEILGEPEIKKLNTTFSVKVYDQWLDKAAKAYMQGDEEYRECPSATCNYGYLHSTKDDGNIFRCQQCEARYCVLCEVVMHEGLTCEQYQESRIQRHAKQQEEERLSEEKVKKSSKRCPNCTISIDKFEGCDHVTCKRCKHEFCWRCFADYNGPNGIRKAGNSAHKETCRHHSKRLPSYRPPVQVPAPRPAQPTPARRVLTPQRPVQRTAQRPVQRPVRRAPPSPNGSP